MAASAASLKLPVFQWNGSQFTKVPGALRMVFAGSDGDVWGLGKQGQVFHTDGTTFTPVSGATLVQISVGSKEAVWGVNQAGEVFHYSNGSFTQVPGSLRHLRGASGTGG